MASFVIEGGHRLSGEIHPQGAKNEVLQIICATLLTAEEVTVNNIPDILDVNNLIQLMREMGVTVAKEGVDTYSFKAENGDLKDGDRIVTSNISSKFLPGILIGYAADITTDQSRLTKSGYLIPAAHFDSLQEVLVITTLKEEEAPQESTENTEGAQTGA